MDHPRLGKRLRGWVVLRQSATRSATPPPSPLALRRYLAERLAPQMVPERVDIRTTMPRTTTGKIDYAALAQS